MLTNLFTTTQLSSTFNFARRQYLSSTTSVPACSSAIEDRASSLNATNLLMYAAANPGPFGCERPCNFVSYGAQVSPYHRNTAAFDGELFDDSSALFFIYTSAVVEGRLGNNASAA